MDQGILTEKKHSMEIPPLLKFLDSLYSLSDKFRDHLHSTIMVTRYPKGTVLEKPVNSAALWFIHKGMIKASFFDDQGKEHITRFWMEGEVILSMGPYGDKDISGSQIVLLEDCTLSTINGNKLLFLYYNFDEASKLAGKILLRDRIKADQKSYICSLSSVESYKEFKKLFPYKRILLKDIAAFLEITPGTLSEIRKTLGKK